MGMKLLSPTAVFLAFSVFVAADQNGASESHRSNAVVVEQIDTVVADAKDGTYQIARRQLNDKSDKHKSKDKTNGAKRKDKTNDAKRKEATNDATRKAKTNDATRKE